ncbi:hypothetical protein BV22DRAFT_1129805 [Leucogyrophana mollusca]|uniref:Uncharacterized protein n=1 Tax=Leucogyrophana mollusca TaxID=85980 RepID=A0ACB8BFU5_9AGAM|nr:hypothetical protein BV22DRAFT_1129805 [Leucogyrophana mollusca]
MGDLKAQLQEARKLLGEEALTLCQHVVEVKVSFGEVAKTLHTLSQNGDLSKGEQQKCDQLHKAWDELSKAYDKLIEESREVAGQVRSTLRDFVDTFIHYISDSKPTVQAKNDALNEIQKALFFTHQKIKADEQKAYKTSQKFSALSADVDVFRATFQTAAEKFQNSLKGQKALTVGDGVPLTEWLHNIALQIKVLATRAASDIVPERVSEFICTASDCFWSEVENPHNTEKPQENYDTQQGLNNPKETLGSLLFNTPIGAHAGRVTALQTAQKTIDDRTADIGSKLGIFTTIWAIINADIGQIRGQMNNAASSKYGNVLFPIRIEHLNDMYKDLMDALEVYECHTTPNKEELEKFPADKEQGLCQHVMGVGEPFGEVAKARNKQELSMLLADEALTLCKRVMEVKESCGEKLKVDQVRAQETSQKFSALGARVDAFRTTFQAVAEDFKHSTKDLKVLMCDGVPLTEWLQKITSQIKVLATQAASDSMAEGISEFLRAVFPYFWNKIENPHNTEKPQKNCGTQQRLNVAQATPGIWRFDPSNGRVRLVKTLQFAQKAIEDCTEDIGPKLSILSRIWAAMRSDIQQSREHADNASSDYGIASFLGRIERPTKLYSLLIDALEVYEYYISVNF